MFSMLFPAKKKTLEIKLVAKPVTMTATITAGPGSPSAKRHMETGATEPQAPSPVSIFLSTMPQPLLALISEFVPKNDRKKWREVSRTCATKLEWRHEHELPPDRAFCGFSPNGEHR